MQNMKLFTSLIFTLIISLSSLAQLDPFYFGTYVDDNFTEGYTIYTMDEVEEDCFLVEYEHYENFESVYGASGFGHCEGENGNMEIQFENSDEKVQVLFGIDEHGMKNLTIKSGENSGKVFREYNDFVPEEGNKEHENGEEIYYSREDGSELVIYSVDDVNLGFTIYSVAANGCEGNDVGGKLTALNEELSLFEYRVDDTCRIEFQISTDSINIIEENCSAKHGARCGDWNGLYKLNR